MSQNNGGDVLARGGVKCTFSPAQTTQQKWDEAFDDFNPEDYRRNANTEQTGDASISSGEAVKVSAKERTRR